MRTFSIRAYMILVGYVGGLLAIGRCLFLHFGLDSGERIRWWLETVVYKVTGLSA